MGVRLDGMQVLEYTPTVSYDEEADAAYIFWSAEDPEKVISSERMPEWLIVDLDENGVLVGFEILGAKQRLGLTGD